MEPRYDPTFDLTDYSQIFQVPCPVCGRLYRVLFSVPDVPTPTGDPYALAAFERDMAVRIARARERFRENRPPCEECSPPPEGAGRMIIHASL